MPAIQVLDKSVSELIAAGEVIEQPASVIKELLENAIDAGARSVTVEIKNGGISYIRITDDGCGIAPEEVPVAFLRHATSKVKTKDDLEGIHTLGFRGEALASIAAVAKVEMLTKTPGNQFGTRYVIEGSVECFHESAGCPDGTTIVIRELFYNTPARLKFLKRDITEANYVAGIVDKLALSHPEVSFRFIRDNNAELHTPGDGNLYSAVYAVCGKQFAQSLIPAEYTSGAVRVNGFIQRPLFGRANRAMQHFFINGRYIKSRTAMAALEEAYKNAIMVGRFPSCVLNLSLSPETIDVNVHPSKTEVRFSDEKAVFDCLYFGAKNALLLEDSAREMSLPKVRASEPVVTESSAPTASAAPRLNPVRIFEPPQPQAEQLSLNLHSPVAQYLAEPRQMVPPLPLPSEQAVTASLDEDSFRYLTQAAFAVKPQQVDVAPQQAQAVTPALHVIGEAFGTYIVAVVDETQELLLIDKHAAHERILFERMKEQRAGMDKQVLLTPLTLTMTKEEYDAVTANADALGELGFTVEGFGSGTVLVREVPLILDQQDAAALIGEIADAVTRNKHDLSPQVLDELYHSMACKAAIRAGDKSNIAELNALAQEVYGNEKIRYCPHGRPVLITLSKKHLEKEFNRQ